MRIACNSHEAPHLARQPGITSQPFHPKAPPPSNIQTEDVACGVDLSTEGQFLGSGRALSFYDSWVARDALGGMVTGEFPHLSDAAGTARARAGLPVPGEHARGCLLQGSMRGAACCKGACAGLPAQSEHAQDCLLKVSMRGAACCKGACAGLPVASEHARGCLLQGSMRGAACCKGARTRLPVAREHARGCLLQGSMRGAACSKEHARGCLLQGSTHGAACSNGGCAGLPFPSEHARGTGQQGSWGFQGAPWGRLEETYQPECPKVHGVAHPMNTLATRHAPAQQDLWNVVAQCLSSAAQATRHALLTDSGDRPAAFAVCVGWVARSRHLRRAAAATDIGAACHRHLRRAAAAIDIGAACHHFLRRAAAAIDIGAACRHFLRRAAAAVDIGAACHCHLRSAAAAFDIDVACQCHWRRAAAAIDIDTACHRHSCCAAAATDVDAAFHLLRSVLLLERNGGAVNGAVAPRHPVPGCVTGGVPLVRVLAGVRRLPPPRAWTRHHRPQRCADVQAAPCSGTCVCASMRVCTKQLHTLS
eukprot:365459-Chlamydomonas_euryale.AAC.10